MSTTGMYKDLEGEQELQPQRTIAKPISGQPKARSTLRVCAAVFIAATALVVLVVGQTTARDTAPTTGSVDHTVAVVNGLSDAAAPLAVRRHLLSEAKIEAVLLGTAGDFAVLAKAGISTIPYSVITGDIGVSPIAASAMTGFSLVAHSSNTYATSEQITGKAYASDYAVPTPSKMTTAIGDMGTAYNDAAGRAVSSTANVNTKAGLISGTVFTTGVYTWDTDVTFDSDIYINGNADELFIFSTTGNIVVADGAKVILQGGAVASNIVWRSAGYLEAGLDSHLEGIFLVFNDAIFKTRSSLNGRVLAQKAITLDMSIITEPEA
jgi:hypothetical protein